MGILGFGKVQKLEDLKVDDLKKERLTQQVKQDQLLTRLRQSQDQSWDLKEFKNNRVLLKIKNTSKKYLSQVDC